ncbi:serine kinase [Ruegeria sediminis]|uniref:Serine kinase n=1 Tax=Ruegeria sediminis TaxID=2583820 RepID=A0ABY2WSL0_9RHOB|nr:HPr kinase/phosphatase C-terminal domain-containing protein [Ruegeria sediminis]TMV03695.1 serine kinase [Ruegeria sediminis]
MGAGALSEAEDLDTAIVHASCVAVAGKGLLIVGRSGSGKSSLALQMMALGAELVADDRVELSTEGEQVMARAPKAIAGLIEARGLGLLRAQPAGPVPLALVLDLDETETARLPAPRRKKVLRQSVPLLHAVDTPHFAAALVQILKMGRVDPEWPGT